LRAAFVTASALLFVLFLILWARACTSTASPGFFRLVDTSRSETWPRGIIQVVDGELHVVRRDVDVLGWELSARLSHLMVATGAWPIVRAVQVWRRRRTGRRG
jgi:hypothetical protein